MLRRAVLVGCVGVAGALVACQPAAAPDTREADVKAVKSLEASWQSDFATKDPEKVARNYADDASMLMTNEPIVTGKDNIKATWKPVFSDPNFALTFQSTRAEAAMSGDVAYSIGTYAFTMTDPKSKKPITDHGKFLTVFKKQADGSWKVVADMASSDVPLPVSGK